MSKNPADKPAGPVLCWNPMIIKGLIGLIGLCILFFAYLGKVSGPSLALPPGIVAPDFPVQAIVYDEEPWQHNGYRITPLARFRIVGRVVLTHRYYWFGDQNSLSPMDVVLAWARASDTDYLGRLSFSHGQREYSWTAKDGGMDSEEVRFYTANIHLIPADDKVDAAIKRINPDDIAFLQGYLVRVESGSGFRWNSSLSREDAGPGSGELLWVEKAAVNLPIDSDF